jgi:hypothetical protein
MTRGNILRCVRNGGKFRALVMKFTRVISPQFAKWKPAVFRSGPFLWGGAFGSLLVLAPKAEAAPDLSDLNFLNTTQGSPSSQSVLDDLLNGSVGFSSIDYLYENANKPNIFNQVEGHILAQGTGGVFQGKLNGEGLAIVGPLTTYTLEAPEAYFGTSPALSDVVEVKVGRELHHWSHLDEEFQLGIWQPRLRWDYVRPEEVGLLGVFVDVETPTFQFVVMGSPMFVPDRGVPEEFQNGGIYSVSPFFNSPASSLQFEGVNTNIDYSLQAPSTMSILNHGVFSIMGRVGGTEGPWASVAYAYKPMNQLLFSYNGVLLTGGAQQTVEATIFPRVEYDHLVSVEAGYESPRFAVWLSTLTDHPDYHNSDPNHPDATEDILGDTYQATQNSFAISPAAEYRLGDLNHNPTRLQVALLRQLGGNENDQGLDATGTGSIFENRYPYQSAGIFEVSTSLGWMGLEGLNARYRVLYDFGHNGSIQSTDFNYLIKNTVMVNLGTDILASHEDESATDPISEYRANNRIRAGVSYVF